jgi:manganese transport protein
VLLSLTEKGHRPYERAVVALLSVIVVGFIASLCVSGFSLPGLLSGTVPSFAGADSMVLAGGIVGATVMPHAIYMHSALTAERATDLGAAARHKLLHAQRSDIPIAMGVAGLVNLAMLVLAATVFAKLSVPVTSLDMAHQGLGLELGAPVALLFALALLASGWAASSVGTYSGQVVMEGFLGLRPPLMLRRLVTMAPALAVLIAGVDPTRALVLSQVALSFGIPFALIPLVLLTNRQTLMGEFTNARRTAVAAAAVATVICLLNLFLITQLFG